MSALAQDSAPTAACSFQPLNFGTFNSAAWGINDFGVITGDFSAGLRSEPQGFVYRRGEFTPFVFPGSTFTVAQDVNNPRRIVGYYFSDVEHGFVLDTRGAFHTVSVPGATNTRAHALNDRGDVVGAADDGDQFVQRAFLLQRGHFTTFSFPGAASTEADGINSYPTIVGTYRDSAGVSHGFKLKSGVFTSIDFPGATNTFASKINDRGVIVGWYDIAGVSHGFVLAKGVFHTIDDPAGGPGTKVLDVNKQKQIVGIIGADDHFSVQAFKADCTGVF
jgi:uncharacterized membrane protein